MKQIRVASLATAAIALGAVLSVAWGQSQPGKVATGTLTCKGKGTIGLILGSKETMSCTFVPTKGAPQNYAASITNVGVDIGVKGASTVVWTVLYSADALPEGFLAGSYGGVSAEASVGVGVGANVLVGGSKNGISLQPLSVQAQTGLNVSGGVTGMTLTYVK